MTIFSAQLFSGKRILVTGASSGIGRVTARMLAEYGAKVLIAGRNHEELLKTFISLPGEGHEYEIFEMDQADMVSDWMRGLAERYGAFFGIFHSAGIEMIRPIRLTKQEQISKVFGAAVFGAFGISRGASQKGVMEDGGSIVFMSSVAGLRGQIGMTAYSAAKASIDGLVRSLACEMAPRKIRVNALIAGAVNTEMHKRLLHAGGGVSKHYEEKHLLGFGEPEDISNTVIFLMSSASRWITGSSVSVDGGYAVR